MKTWLEKVINITLIILLLLLPYDTLKRKNTQHTQTHITQTHNTQTFLLWQCLLSLNGASRHHATAQLQIHPCSWQRQQIWARSVNHTGDPCCRTPSQLTRETLTLSLLATLEFVDLFMLLGRLKIPYVFLTNSEFFYFHIFCLQLFVTSVWFN